MRNINRIPIYLGLLKDKKFIINGVEVDFSKIEFELLEETWVKNPDWRLTQLLVNTGITPNLPGFWYYVEDAEFLVSLGFKMRDGLIWGTNFDKDMNKLPETIWRPIKDLTTDHIQAILDGKWVKEGSLHYKYFTEELEFRKTKDYEEI
jgi:hypothetical protein